jgi:hypothetical protein
VNGRAATSSQYGSTRSVDFRRACIRMLAAICCTVFGYVDAYPADPAASSPSAEDITAFEQNIRPFFANKCYACHGPEKQDAGLRLDIPPDMRGSGQFLLANDTSKGSLLSVLQNKDPQVHPLGDVSARDLELLLQWISRGAPWPPSAPIGGARQSMEKLIATSRNEHWSFKPVQQPEIPQVNDNGWGRSPIDAFVFAKLRDAGLVPSPPAKKRTLLRRAYYDLIGLPPTSEEIEQFENDTSDDAFERVVDRLLDSPHYGERWGRYWLDVARYSDTRGSSFREDRYFPFSYTYRDYVIRAFNEDLPYDQFILQQLAADQLDLGEDKRPLAAMGYLTLGRTFNGNLHDVIDDRIDVVSRGLQGMSVNCARCHDHKFDPIPTADYYSMYGIFRSAQTPSELPLIGKPDTASEAYQEYEKGLKKLEAAREELETSVHIELLTHARDNAGKYLQAAHEAAAFTEDAQFEKQARDRELKAKLVKKWLEYLKKSAERHDPIFAPWSAFAALTSEQFAEKAATMAPAFAANADLEHPINALVAKAFEGAPPASMDDVNQKYASLLGDVDKQWKDMLAAHTQRGPQSDETQAPVPQSLADENAERLRLVLYGVDSPANIPADDVYGLVEYETRLRLAQRRRAVETHQGTHPGRPDHAMALENTPEPVAAYVFKRGDPENKGPDVPRQYLAVLATGERKPFAGHGRLELAQAIADKSNPLTARVFVNRVWMQHFGRPIVPTPSDFGLRGERPTHPELLDYLAWRFMEDGWRIKQLHRRIMLSSTYQQASDENETGRAADTANILLWRQNRRRLDFEAMRDSVLKVANNLDLHIGGHPLDITKPPFANRRTVYAEIDREDLPSMFRIFDFAEPTTHSPGRFNTTVPQQALFMMNSPFVAEQARLIASPPEPDAEQQIRAMYRKVYMRDPIPSEIELARSFVDGQDTAEATTPYYEPSDWKYGYGVVDETKGQVATFTEFTHWSGDAYQGADKLPGAETGWALLNRLGGHPGDRNHAVVRRWTSPADSTVSCVGELYHNSSEGDGVIGYIVSSREGILWRGAVKDGMVPTVANNSQIRAGDTIDLVVACNENESEDAFRWHPRVYLSSPEAASLPKQDWITRFDFQGPPPSPPVPLKPWEQYAQVLLMSNEFMFVD